MKLSHGRYLIGEIACLDRMPRSEPMKDEPDFLDELITEGEASTPGFALMVEAALERRRLLRRLAQEREELGLSQTAVAAEMGTSQSAVARLESGNGDVKMSTVERYASTLGRKVEWQIKATGSSQSRRRVATARKAAARKRR
jgi:DNA-binding XRE family transcriptional regulator